VYRENHLSIALDNSLYSGNEVKIYTAAIFQRAHRAQEYKKFDPERKQLAKADLLNMMN
jgi:hypothetical protein